MSIQRSLFDACLAAVAVVGFLGVPPSAAFAQSCGATITTNLTLTADLDLTGCTGTALTVGANGITIDGQGHTILAPDASIVLGLTGHSGVSVVNVTLVGAIPLQLSSSTGNLISGVQVPGNGAGSGIGVVHSSNNQIVGCTVSGRAYGVRFDGVCTGNVIQGNTLTGNTTAVIGAGSGDGNQILGNDLSGSTSYAIEFSQDNAIAIAGNNYTGSSNGIFLANMHGITLAGPDLSQVPGIALNLVNVFDSTFTAFPANAASIPVALSSCGSNTISAVQAPGSGTGFGIGVVHSSNNRIEGCTVTGRAYGVRFDGSVAGNLVQGNTLTGNTTAVIGAGSGDGNQILGNDLSGSTSYAIEFSQDNAIAIAGNNYTGSSNGIFLANMHGITLAGPDLSQVPGIALNLVNVFDSTFTAFPANAASIPVALSSCGSNTISAVQAPGSGTGFGIGVVHSSNNRIEGCTVTGRAYGVRFDGSVAGNLVQGNTLTGNTTAVIGAGSGDGNQILGNDLSGSTSYAIEFSQDNAIAIAGNNYTGSSNGIFLANMHGITLAGPDLSQVPGIALNLVNVFDSTFTAFPANAASIPVALSSCGSNTISAVQAPGSGTGFGIGVVHSSNNLIEGCTVTGRVYGVRFDGITPGNLVQGNTLTGNTTAVIGAGSGDGNQILGNDLSGSTSYAIEFSQDNAIAIAGNNYTGSSNGIFLANMHGITLAGPDLSQVPGIALNLVNVFDSTFTAFPANAASIPVALSSCGSNTISAVQAPGSGAGFGIGVVHSSNNRIEGCTVTGRVYGVRFDGITPGNLVQGNTLTGNTTAVIGAGSGDGNQILNNDLSGSTSYAIEFSQDNAIAIAGNVYTGSANGIFLANMNGITLSGADLNHVAGIGLNLANISNATFTNIFAPAEGAGVSMSNCVGNSFSDVDVSTGGPAQSGFGFALTHSASNTIENSSANYRIIGVNLHGAANLIQCSVITHNGIGMLATGGFLGNALRHSQVSDNSIRGLDTDAPIDAENNYWGSPDGPSPTGSGDAIAGPVDADPFFASLATLLGACPGIVNSPPGVACSGGGTYQVAIDDVTLEGSVSDLEGQWVSFEWREGAIVYASGSVQSQAGGAPVALPAFSFSTGVLHDPSMGVIGLGSHTITLTVNDGTNSPVECVVEVQVVDTQAPTLAPASNIGTLWPPDHQMVDVVIFANASDNSGGAVTLTATVTSSEPADAPGAGDGNTSPDFTEPVISQELGVITLQLRAERAGNGPGRTYSVTITATDEFGNSATAVIVFRVPHDTGH